MKKYYYTIIIFLIHLSANSQKLKGEILNENNGQKLAFVNLVIKGKNVGTYSNNEGYFELSQNKFNLSDTLVVSIIGFEEKLLPLQNIPDLKKTLSINLQPKIFELKEVVISSDKVKYRKIGKRLFSGNRKTVFPSSVPYGYEVATKFSQNKAGKIKSLKLKFRNTKKGGYQVLPTFYRVKFYEIKKDQSPGELLSHKNIIIHPKERNSSINLSLDSLNIYFPINGFFIGIETIKPNNTKIKSTLYITNPSILYTNNKTNLTYKRFGSNNWKTFKKKSVFKKNHYSVPYLKVNVAYRK